MGRRWDTGVTVHQTPARREEGGSARGCEGEIAARAAVFHPPTMRNRQPSTVTLTQVVGVRISFGRQVVEPYGRAGILVREGHNC